MSRCLPVLALSLILSLSACVTTGGLRDKAADYQSIPTADCVPLFDGKSLDGWKQDVPKADKDPSIPPSFGVRDGNLVSFGVPLGHLVSDQAFANYKLVLEYRFPGKPGNCGVLTHVSKLRLRNNMFPQSLEVQMQHGHAGDFWCIGEDIKVPDMELRRPRREGQQWGGIGDQARHIRNLTDGSESPLGKWNRMEIICIGDEIVVWVNGDLVNHGYSCTADSGRIALQAEGAEVEFRRVDVYPLKP